MARKLNTEEEQLFVEALRKEAGSNDPAGAQFLLRFSEKRDSEPRLAPELVALFGEDPLGPIIS